MRPARGVCRDPVVLALELTPFVCDVIVRLRHPGRVRGGRQGGFGGGRHVPFDLQTNRRDVERVLVITHGA